MKTFVIAHCSLHDGKIEQEIIHNYTKEMALCEFLVARGWDVTWYDCTDKNIPELSDIFITAMELVVHDNIIKVKNG